MIEFDFYFAELARKRVAVLVDEMIVDAAEVAPNELNDLIDLGLGEVSSADLD